MKYGFVVREYVNGEVAPFFCIWRETDQGLQLHERHIFHVAMS
jgi:hypothetical protein